MSSGFTGIVPVIPSADVERDIDWFYAHTGFNCLQRYSKDGSDEIHYALLGRDNLYIHLQWHADTPEDPLNGGSVIRIYVNNINPIYQEYLQRGTVGKNDLRKHTDWNTNEFSFQDPNKNIIFIVEDLD